VVARLVAAAAFTCVAIHFRGPADLLPLPERPFAYGTADVRIEGPAYPRHATGADDVRVQVARVPRRILSQDSRADEYLYAVTPPARVVGVSAAAYEPRISNLTGLVDRYRPIVATDPEQVLRAQPDLVLSPASARADTIGLLRQAGLPVYRIHTMPETLASIEAHIRLVGYLTGEDARAGDEIARFRAAVARAAARRPAHGSAPAVLGLGGTYSYGSKTLFADVLRVLGAENVAALHGLTGYDRVTDEHIVRWDPEWIVAGADRGSVEATRARLLASPAIAATTAAKRGQVVVLEQQVFLPMSQLTAGLVEALSAALYGGGGS
jgi:iron complex transport system substrate-binding protein